MTTPKKKKSWKRYLFLFLAALIAFPYFQCLWDGVPLSVRPYIDQADQRAHDAVDESLGELNAFFEQANTNARPFAETAFSMGTKWRLMVDFVPFTKGNRHEEYLKAKFNEMVFSDEQLVKVVKDTVADYLRRLENIDNKMLVDIRADLPDIAEGSILQTLDEQRLLETYREMIEKVRRLYASKSANDIGANAVSFAAGEITSQVLGQIAVRLGISSGILVSGAGSSLVTLGIGQVVAFIVDYIIAIIWDWYADPKGNLAADIVRGIDSIRNETVICLREHLADLARQHRKHRKEMVRTFLNQQADH